MPSPLPELNTPAKIFSDTQIALNQFEEKLNWEELYSLKGPVIVEIGSGKGRFIIKSAAENPDKNFLGIEKSLRYSRVLKKRAEKAGLTNFRLLNAEAGYFISKYVPENSVSEYHIYFPDHWPKKRHNKRRLINPAFLKAMTLSLKPGGCIYYATDFKNYFDQMVDVSRTCEEIKETAYQEINPADEDPEAALTNYERKYLIQGRQIYKAAYEKL